MKRVVVMLGLLAVAMMTLAACGGGGGSTKDFKVGITLPSAQNETIQAVADGLRAEVEQHGGTLVTADDQLNIDKQIADIDQFIAQGMDAIVVWPLDPKAITGVLERADAAGIKIFAHDAVLDESRADELGPIISQVTEGRKAQAEEAAAFLADKLPDGGNVVAITIGPPVPTHLYLLEQFERALAEYPNLKFLEKQGNPTDDTAGARPLMESFLTKYPDIDAVYTYNDPSAIGAATAVKAAGRRDTMTITGYNASVDGIDAVTRGLVDATWDYRPVEIGQTLGRLVWLAVSGEMEEAELPRVVLANPKMYLKEEASGESWSGASIADFVPWNERVKQIEEGEYLGEKVE